ncbi:MAG TPA: type IV pilus modification protein PilV [Thermomonas sp.]|nr:type IV pilus modification protein PilV [Thermomonas sp.]
MIRRSRPSTMPRHARGIGLIEVMVSVMVLAVGLLGIAAMQSMALRGGQGSLESTQAVMATNSILEAIRANRTAADSYNMAKTCTIPTAGGSAVANDKIAWITDLKSTIGSGTSDSTTCGQITNCDDANATNCTITVFWDDSRAGTDVGGSGRSLSVEAQI